MGLLKLCSEFCKRARGRWFSRRAHGPWMYFVTVNPKTGLTKFTSSFAQFQKFRAELAANIAKGK